MNTTLTLSQRAFLSLVPSNFAKHYKNVGKKSNSFSRRASTFDCFCLKDYKVSESHKSFSVLKTNGECDMGSMWSSMGFYIFTIHVPLSFGGLSAAAKILHQPVLSPQIEMSMIMNRVIVLFPAKAFLILGIQSLELSLILLLLNYSGKPRYNLEDFFRSSEISEERSPLLASVVGSVFLLSLVFITSFLADRFVGTKDVSNPILEQILSSGSFSSTACIFAYCLVTPVLEEVVYGGFLLTSLASKLEWPRAVAISSIVFSAAHFSADNFLQLLAIGCVLGCAYCWTGKLTSSIIVHSSYNALVLFLTFISFMRK